MVKSNNDKIQLINQKYFKKDAVKFEVGDEVKMKIKVQEADKTRLHPFEGTIIRKTTKGPSGSFTVRKISFGEGVERTFPLNSPVVEGLTVVSKGKVNRAKLYYLRERTGKKARLQREEETGAEAPQINAPVREEA